jgi:hypothetical protein
MSTLATLPTDGFSENDCDERKSAVRNLKRLAKADSRVKSNDEFVSKYLALRKLKGGDRARITAEMLLNCKSKETVTNALTQTFYVLPKSRRPSLESEIANKFFIDPKLMEKLPHGFQAADIWVLDKAIPQSELGVGVFEWSTTVTSTVLAPSDDVMALHSGDAPQAVDSQNRPDSTRPAGENSSSGTPTSKLLSTASRRKTTSEDVFEGIARETKLAAEYGRFFSELIQDASTVEFWLRAYVAHISSLHEEYTAKRSSENETSNEAFVDTLPEHIKDYLGFVLETLLNSQCDNCLPKFTYQFEIIDEICPQLLPPIEFALIQLTGDILCVLMYTYNMRTTYFPLHYHIITTDLPTVNAVLPFMYVEPSNLMNCVQHCYHRLLTH